MQAHPRGRFIIAGGSSHFIPGQEPELAAEEILRVVRTVRGNHAATESADHI